MHLEFVKQFFIYNPKGSTSIYVLSQHNDQPTTKPTGTNVIAWLNVRLPRCSLSTLPHQVAWEKEYTTGWLLENETVSEWCSHNHNNNLCGDSVTACLYSLFILQLWLRKGSKLFTQWISVLYLHMKVWEFCLVCCFWVRVSLCGRFWSRTCYLDWSRIYGEPPDSASCMSGLSVCFVHIWNFYSKLFFPVFFKSSLRNLVNFIK